MKFEAERETILSIETAVAGGSISIFEDGYETDFWVGETRISKAEEILEQIQKLFEKNSIKKKSVKLIMISAGPGSTTGIKIGLSLAKGLARAFNCSVCSVSVLDALISEANPAIEGLSLTAIPVGKNLISWQVFENKSSDGFAPLAEPQIVDYLSFQIELTSGKYSQAVLHNSILSQIKENPAMRNVKLIDAGNNMAKLARPIMNKTFKLEIFNNYN